MTNCGICENLFEAIVKSKPGTISRISYKSEVPLKSAFKKQYSIIKITETSNRLGVCYDNINAVKEDRKNNPDKKKRVLNYTWIVKNKILKNENNGEFYLNLASFPNGDNAKVEYHLMKIEEDGTKTQVEFEKDSMNDFMKEMVINSYLTKKNSPVIKRINLKNILSLNGVNAEA